MQAHQRRARPSHVTNQDSGRCIRCNVPFDGHPYLMAGRSHCCNGCSVGSACEHQGVHRDPDVRRYDTMFDRFRNNVRGSNPLEPTVIKGGH